MKLDPTQAPDTKNQSQCKIQSLIWLLEHITRDIREERMSLHQYLVHFNFFKTLATFINVSTLK